MEKGSSQKDLFTLAAASQPKAADTKIPSTDQTAAKDQTTLKKQP
jgi:hypothetical protein